MGLLLATSSETRAYAPLDKIDDTPCHINWAILNAPAYVTTDGRTGTKATRQGYGTDVSLDTIFHFDRHTCPISLHHGGLDPYSPNGSTLVYRQLRRMKVPTELHLYPDVAHRALGLERGIEFIKQMGFLGSLDKEVPLMSRYDNDEARGNYKKEAIWPKGKMPDRQDKQCVPYLEWHFPKVLKTKAIQKQQSRRLRGGSLASLPQREGHDRGDHQVSHAATISRERALQVHDGMARLAKDHKDCAQ